MGNCNASTVAAESSEIQAESAQRHPSLMSLPLRTNMKFGWRPDMPDHRDLRVTFDKVDAPSHIKKRAEGDGFAGSIARVPLFVSRVSGFLRTSFKGR